MMDVISVHIIGKSIPEKVRINSETIVEDVIIKICQLQGIGPVARHLFGIRLLSSKIWLSLCLKAKDIKSDEFEFRLRYNLPDLNRLKQVDAQAYNFYFNQVKFGILSNKMSEISYDTYKSQIIGLCVLDMYRATMEDGVTKREVEKDYKKFFPNEVLRRHLFFIKKPVMDALNGIKMNTKPDACNVKKGYLDQFKNLAPRYLTEEYNALINEGDNVYSATINVDPFHEESPGMRIKYDGKDEWLHTCTIDDLCYINIRNDGTVEISRKNGIPIYLKFHSLPVMTSFVTLLENYYRLMVKWTFNLCKDLPCPSLNKLMALKCHGPISGEFSYRKLEEKKNNKPGSFILRQSDRTYDVYYLDFCVKNRSKPVTYKIEMTSEGRYVMENDKTKTYESLKHLLNDYRSPNGEIFLQECVPPSEFDQSNLLLCQVDNYDAPHTVNKNNEVPSNVPVCIDSRTLRVFKNMPRDGCCSLTTVYRGFWCKDKATKLDVAIKVLNEKDQQKHLMEFLSLTSRWAFVTSNSTVKMFGITLANPISIVMEYLPLGQLDVYLSNKDKHDPVKEVDLVEASTYLANALWYLEDAGFVHGNIRCRKLLVANHTDNSFVVKLADPGLYSAYTDDDIRWIPPECYGDFGAARYSSAADIWAFGTTLWEIFSYGKSPPKTDVHTLRKFHLSQKHLPRPAGCPRNVYQLMLECWALDPHCRKKPQAAMRDINQILYQVYNSRQGHSYSTIIPRNERRDSSSNKSDSVELNESIFSEATLNTFVDDSDEQSTAVLLSETNSTINEDDLFTKENSLCCETFSCTTDKREMMAIISKEDFYGEGGTISSMQSIFELDQEWNLILTGRIGEGYYGEVYRGMLEHIFEKQQQLVAVKKMKLHAITTSSQADFDREISIMLKLNHPNIVRIRGVVRDPELCLVLEYIERGSLQCYLKIHKDRLLPHHLLKFALDVAKGMAYLVEKKVVHRDLAARNILVVNEYNVKISDFGLARFIGSESYYMFKTERDLPLKWYAPESIEFGKFSHCSDVWSYGVTLFEMFSFADDPALPITEHDEQYSICTALKTGIRLPCPKMCPQYIYVNLMSPCWKYSSSQRPTFAQLVSIIEQILPSTDDIKYETQPV